MDYKGMIVELLEQATDRQLRFLYLFIKEYL